MPKLILQTVLVHALSLREGARKFEDDIVPKVEEIVARLDVMEAAEQRETQEIITDR
jgi:hypothetical protein